MNKNFNNTGIFTTCRQFMSKYTSFKVFILISFVMLFFTALIEVKSIEMVNVISRHIFSLTDDKNLKWDMFIYFMSMINYYLVFYILSTVYDYYTLRILRNAMVAFLNDYYSVDQKTYSSLGTGKINVLVERRSFALAKVIEIIFFHCFYKSFFLVYAIYSIYTKFSAKLCIFFICQILLMFLFTFQLYKLRNRKRRAYTGTYDIVMNRIYNILQNYDVIKSYNREKKDINNMDDVLTKLEDEGIIVTTFDSVISLITKVSILIPNFILYALVLKGYAFAELKSPYSFFFYNRLFVIAKSKFNDLRGHFLVVAQHKTDIENSNLNDVKQDKQDNEIELFNFEDEIKLENFGLSIEGKELLKDVNLRIKKGDKIAIVGKNGVGKSSIIGVLLRFKEYDGSIYVDGVDMKTIDKSSQRDKVSYVPQNPGLMKGTVLHNLRYGNKDLSKDQVVELCREYNMDEFILNLKDGYETDVGECGKFLSGGQKQKVGFMRAVVKDGEIFIFDEPTANIDPKTELQIFNMIFEKLKDKTIIAIVHNQKLLRMFDKILGIKDLGFTEYNSYDEYLEHQHFY